jgi:Flp pilus assembly protein TadG
MAKSGSVAHLSLHGTVASTVRHLLGVCDWLIILAFAAETTNQGEVVLTIKRRQRRRARRDRGHLRLGDAGQALVEVAIALPILLGLLVGIFEFARAYNVQQVITNAAREGAREGVLPTATQADALTRANARLSDGNVSGATVTWSCTGSPCDTGDAVSIAISVPYTFRFIGPVVSLFAPGATDPGTITLSSTATMRRE